jgi:hypothetical protein
MKWLNSTDLVCEEGERVVWRQVGWRGFTDRFYSLEENPKLTEPGGWSPIYIQIGD